MNQQEATVHFQGPAIAMRFQQHMLSTTPDAQTSDGDFTMTGTTLLQRIAEFREREESEISQLPDELEGLRVHCTANLYDVLQFALNNARPWGAPQDGQ